MLASTLPEALYARVVFILMKAAYFSNPGPPEVIQVGQVAETSMGADQALVRVHATSVNPIDTYIRNGANYWPLPTPYIIGCDLAGTVERVGEQVRNVTVGQRVWGSNQGLMGRQGASSELASVDAHWLYPIPESASEIDMAAIALVGITAHLGLFGHAKLQPGEIIFVRGGSGGVGSMVIQMAKAIGAQVITTARDASRAERCQALGADHVIRYTEQDVATELQKLAPDGVHVYWETLREPNFDLSVGAMREGGRMILMAGRDARPTFPVGPFYVKGCSLHGFAMFKAPVPMQQRAASDINHWVAAGKLKAVIDRVLPLDEAAQAHRLQEANTIGGQGSLQGKLVLSIP